MLSEEFQSLTVRLSGLADAFGRKPLTEAGLSLWWDTLKPLRSLDVRDALERWSREQTKFPSPADIYKFATNADIDRREQHAAQTSTMYRKPADWRGVSEIGFLAIASLKALVSKKSDPGRQVDTRWAQRIIDHYVDGEAVDHYPLALACSVLRLDPGYVVSLRTGSGD